MSFKVESTAPILRIFDEAKAREFYIDYLGFTVDWEHRFDEHAPLYMQVSRDGMVLHLSEHYGDGTPGSRVFYVVNDLRAYHRELSARPYKNLNPGVEPTFYGALCMTLIDPFSNQLSLNEYSQDIKAT